MKSEKGGNTTPSLVLLIIVASVITLSFSYWAGFLTNKGPPKYEQLKIAAITYVGIDSILSKDVFKILIKNTGTIDSKLEYLFINGTLTRYGDEVFGILKLYNPSEYLVITHGSQAEVYFTYQSTKYSYFEIHLQTLAGNEFSQGLTLSKTLN